MTTPAPPTSDELTVLVDLARQTTGRASQAARDAHHAQTPDACRLAADAYAAAARASLVVAEAHGTMARTLQAALAASAYREGHSIRDVASLMRLSYGQARTLIRAGGATLRDVGKPKPTTQKTH